MTSKRFLAALSLATAVFAFAFHASTPVAQPKAETAPTMKVDFERDIHPIFERACVSCHGPAMQMSAYRLDTKQPALAGGTVGKAIVPGNAASSPLYMRVAGIGELARMPFGGKPLDAPEIALIKAWIDEGADWPDSVPATSHPGSTTIALSPAYERSAKAGARVGTRCDHRGILGDSHRLSSASPSARSALWR